MYTNELFSILKPSTIASIIADIDDDTPRMPLHPDTYRFYIDAQEALNGLIGKHDAQVLVENAK